MDDALAVVRGGVARTDVWAVRTDLPRTYAVLEGVHRAGTYREQVLIPYVSEATVMTALTALQEQPPP